MSDLEDKMQKEAKEWALLATKDSKYYSNNAESLIKYLLEASFREGWRTHSRIDSSANSITDNKKNLRITDLVMGDVVIDSEGTHWLVETLKNTFLFNNRVVLTRAADQGTISEEYSGKNFYEQGFRLANRVVNA